MKLKKSQIKEFIRQAISEVISEDMDDKFVSIGYGRYKEKGKEKDVEELVLSVFRDLVLNGVEKDLIETTSNNQLNIIIIALVICIFLLVLVIFNVCKYHPDSKYRKPILILNEPNNQIKDLEQL